MLLLYLLCLIIPPPTAHPYWLPTLAAFYHCPAHFTTHPTSTALTPCPLIRASPQCAYHVLPLTSLRLNLPPLTAPPLRLPPAPSTTLTHCAYSPFLLTELRGGRGLVLAGTGAALLHLNEGPDNPLQSIVVLRSISARHRAKQQQGIPHGAGTLLDAPAHHT